MDSNKIRTRAYVLGFRLGSGLKFRPIYHRRRRRLGIFGQIWNISGQIWKYSGKPEKDNLF